MPGQWQARLNSALKGYWGCLMVALVPVTWYLLLIVPSIFHPPCHGDSIKIQLDNDVQLDDCEAGSWIRELALPSQDQYLTIRVFNRLKDKGDLIQVSKDEKSNEVYSYRYSGVSKQFLIDAHVPPSEPQKVWISIPMSPGISWSDLIGDKGASIRAPSNCGAVYITGVGSQERLVLYGEGVYCTKVVLY